ncbi:MAG: InlB B-repeat-containing protein [Bacillota bacterium]
MSNFKKLLFIFLIFTIFLPGCSKKASVKVTVIPNNSGEVTGTGEYKVGSKVNLKARPNKNYQFIGWEKNEKIIEKQQKYEFDIKKNENLLAKFEKKKVDIKILSNNLKKGSVDGSGEYLINEEVSIKAKPKNSFEFKGWFDEFDQLISKKSELKVNADSNKKYVAKFKVSKVKVNLKSNIKKAEIYGQGEFIKGSKQTIRANELKGYNFSHWEDKKGNVFIKDNYAMLKVDKDLNLTAVYEKQEEPNYLGLSKSEIKDYLKAIFMEYFHTVEAAHGISYNYYKNASDDLKDSVRKGEYFVSLRPFDEGYYEFHNIDFIKKVEVKNIIKERNKLIIKASLEVPKLKQSKDEYEIKNELISNMPIVNKTFSSFFTYDSIETEKYIKEVHLKKTNDNLKLIYLEKPSDIYSKYKNLYQSIIIKNIESINIYIEDSKFKKTIVNYNGKKYEGKFNYEIFDYKKLFPKINFNFNSGITINLSELYNNIRGEKSNINIADLYLFRGLEFYKENDTSKITFGSNYARGTGASIQSIIGFYDLDKDRYNITNELQGLHLSKNKQFSTKISYSSEAVAVTFNDLLPNKHLVIFNLKLKNRIEVNDYLPEEYTENHTSLYPFPFKYKNINWINKNKLSFDLFSINKNNEVYKKVASYIFDLEKDKLIKND